MSNQQTNAGPSNPTVANSIANSLQSIVQPSRYDVQVSPITLSLQATTTHTIRVFGLEPTLTTNEMKERGNHLFKGNMDPKREPYYNKNEKCHVLPVLKQYHDSFPGATVQNNVLFVPCLRLGTTFQVKDSSKFDLASFTRTMIDKKVPILSIHRGKGGLLVVEFVNHHVATDVRTIILEYEGKMLQWQQVINSNTVDTSKAKTVRISGGEVETIGPNTAKLLSFQKSIAEWIRSEVTCSYSPSFVKEDNGTARTVPAAIYCEVENMVQFTEFAKHKQMDYLGRSYTVSLTKKQINNPSAIQARDARTQNTIDVFSNTLNTTRSKVTNLERAVKELNTRMDTIDDNYAATTEAINNIQTWIEKQKSQEQSVPDAPEERKRKKSKNNNKKGKATPTSQVEEIENFSDDADGDYPI